LDELCDEIEAHVASIYDGYLRHNLSGQRPRMEFDRAMCDEMEGINDEINAS